MKWFLKLMFSFIAVVVGVLLWFVTFGQLFLSLLAIVSLLLYPAPGTNYTLEIGTSLFRAGLLGSIAWILTIWLPQKLFFPTHLHPKVLARLKSPPTISQKK